MGSQGRGCEDAKTSGHHVFASSPTTHNTLPKIGIGHTPLIAGIILAVLVAALGLSWGQTQKPSPPVAEQPPAPTDGCRGQPKFSLNPALGLAGTLAIATDGPEKGLTLTGSQRPDAPYQHPTWDDAGFLGPIAYDDAGNIYVAPTPRLSLIDNPLEGVTTLWRIDTASGEMKPFVTLPGAASERNPYGVLGLTYACDIDRLFAGTVVGSTPATERGGVVAISRDGRGLDTILSGIDVMGVLVVRVGNGYELYAGLARSPEIVAIPLDAAGKPTGPRRNLIDLTAAGASPSERARKLRLQNGELIADLVPFNYSLQSSASGQPQGRRMIWIYDLASKIWRSRD